MELTSESLGQSVTVGQGGVGLTVVGVSHRERERLDKKKAAKSPLVPESGPSLTAAKQQQDIERPHKLQQAEAKVQMLNLKVSRL